MRSITVKSREREEMVEITGEVERVLAEASAEENHPVGETPPPLLRKEGSLLLFTQHTTCGLTINENADPDVKSDMLGWLRRLVPQFPSVAPNSTTPPADHPALEDSGTPPFEGGELFFKHFEHNSDAHIKASLMGSSVMVPFEDGKLLLGRWQGVYLCEFDGPRERKVLVKMLS